MMALYLKEYGLIDSLRLLELVIDHLPLAMFAKDPANDFRMVLWNRHAEDLWRFKKAEVIGKSDAELFSQESAEFFRKMDVQTLAQKKVVFIEREAVENQLIGKRWVRTWKVPICDPATGDPVYLLGISQDLTELIESESKKEQFEQVLALQREKLANASRLAALGEMSGGIAHEINSPLGVISLHVEVALSLMSQPNCSMNAIQNHLQKIQETTFRIAKIVQSIKNVARGSGTDDQCEWISLGSLIDDLIALSQHRLRLQDVSVNNQGVAKNVMILCQSVQISQVLLNLLNNSMDAIANRSDRWVQIESRDLDEHWYEIRFVDSGEGISAEVRKRLFDTFFTTKGVKEGTGLGLSISRGILQAHEGDLYLDTTAPNTTFVLRLPKRRIQLT